MGYSYTGIGPRPYGGRGRPRNLDLDERIMEAAVLQLIEYGYDRASLGAISARAGVGRTAISRRWFNRIDLLSDAVQRMIEPPSMDRSRYPLLDLQKMLGMYAEAASDGRLPRLQSVAFIEEFRHPELMTMARKAVLWPRRAMFRAPLDRTISGGLVRRDVNLDIVIDMLAGAAFERRTAGLYFEEYYAVDMLDIMLHGILRPEVASYVTVHSEA